VDYQVDETVPTLTIRYKSRKDAELALSHGKSFPGAPNLEVQWHIPPGAGAKIKEDDDLQGGMVVGGDEMGGSASADEDEEEENEVKTDFTIIKRWILNIFF